MQELSKKRNRGRGGLSLKRKASEFTEGLAVHPQKKPCTRKESADDESPSSLLSERAKCELAKLLPCPHPLTPLPPSQSIIPDSDSEAGDGRGGSINSAIKWTRLPPPDLQWLTKQPLRPLSLQQPMDLDSCPQSSMLEEQEEASSVSRLADRTALTQSPKLHTSSRASTSVPQTKKSGNTHPSRPVSPGVITSPAAQFVTANHHDNHKNRTAIDTGATGMPPSDVSSVEMEDWSGSPPQITGKEEGEKLDFDKDFLDDDLEVFKDVIVVTDSSPSSSSSDDLPAVKFGTPVAKPPTRPGSCDLQAPTKSECPSPPSGTANITDSPAHSRQGPSDSQQASTSIKGRCTTLSEPSNHRMDIEHKPPLHTPTDSQLGTCCPICDCSLPSGFSQLQVDEHLARCLSGFLSD